jgi:hypothetical protein
MSVLCSASLFIRALGSDAPLRRSIIRHMFIILDLSESMEDKDFRPSRYELFSQKTDVSSRCQMGSNLELPQDICGAVV